MVFRIRVNFEIKTLTVYVIVFQFNVCRFFFLEQSSYVNSVPVSLSLYRTLNVGIIPIDCEFWRDEARYGTVIAI